MRYLQTARVARIAIPVLRLIQELVSHRSIHICNDRLNAQYVSPLRAALPSLPHLFSHICIGWVEQRDLGTIDLLEATPTNFTGLQVAFTAITSVAPRSILPWTQQDPSILSLRLVISNVDAAIELEF